MLAVFGSKAARHLLHSKIKKKLATQAFLANRAANDFSQTEEPRTLLSCMNFPISFHIYGTEHSDELVPNVTEADVAELNQEFQTFFGDSCDDSAHDSSTVIRSFPTVELSSQDRTGLTHVDSEGKASMVDLSSFPLFPRPCLYRLSESQFDAAATASGRVVLGREAFELVKANKVKKGDVLSVAQLAGIQGAKATSQIIPLCHNIFLSSVEVALDLEEEDAAVKITSTARTVGPTGVEMEALTATAAAALTVYDMCKAVSKDIVIRDILLESKSGGRAGASPGDEPPPAPIVG
eukprot:CAMPEP_0177617506 /NCGR_PEP_ID=MMETSP0419_2-20121207/24926_1 /TAXON_ID=582737 /ORGANISM="Tetraselmis sp., Strain GSL018" /LENGTH=293 /DNA_ID=CAMNT_0019116037 /DNA_START=45 /DNA_END=925 /DNA_ORIENTATION=-